MEHRQFEATAESNATWRLARKVAIVGVLLAGYVFLMQSSAFASPALSSTILSNSVAGLVPTPLGANNGPITQSNVGSILGSDNGASSSIGERLADGRVTAYIRSWNHQPTDGDAVLITGFEFTNASDESSFVNGYRTGLQNEEGSQPFTVTGIPGATGAEVHTSTSGTPLTEYLVSFAKGDTAFQVVVVSSSGDLTSADAISLANRQFVNAPDIPAASSQIDWHWIGGVPLVGLLLSIAIFVVGRKRKYPTALSGLPPQSVPNWGPSAVVPSGPLGPYSSSMPIPTDARR